MINEPDYSDPAYWESLGITPIVINCSDQDSIDLGFNEVSERIEDAVKELTEPEERDF
ncbi:hypothetical protein [Nostoc sp.]|uniref:hypothetical protein n=1 Tax=Nostoc sp. TaxID=1180 RepID=UPI002FF73A5C